MIIDAVNVTVVKLPVFTHAVNAFIKNSLITLAIMFVTYSYIASYSYIMKD